MKRAAAIFLAGAAVGTLGDRVHTYWGVLGYPRPVLFGEPWWVPPEFGLAGLALVYGHGLLQKALGEARGGGPSRDVWLGGAWLAAAYLATGALKAYPYALAVAFVAAFVARALSARSSRVKWAHALAVAAGGTLAESALCAAGAFFYYKPQFLGVPAWLPGLYLHAALLARAVDRRWPG